MIIIRSKRRATFGTLTLSCLIPRFNTIHAIYVEAFDQDSILRVHLTRGTRQNVFVFAKLFGQDRFDSIDGLVLFHAFNFFAQQVNFFLQIHDEMKYTVNIVKNNSIDVQEDTENNSLPAEYYSSEPPYQRSYIFHFSLDAFLGTEIDIFLKNKLQFVSASSPELNYYRSKRTQSFERGYF